MDEMLADAFDNGINGTGSDAVLNELYDQAEAAFDNWQATPAAELDESVPDYELLKESYVEAYRAGFYEGGSCERAEGSVRFRPRGGDQRAGRLACSRGGRAAAGQMEEGGVQHRSVCRLRSATAL